mmetsp:Transcript_20394/g.28600  ORF Transcript_20394/g.28600 Transcript_20394/m.28600 type:complete len:296 (+) Transcript_20394:71-958(+)|eukprot:CAMPEP_0168565510 /NCGR_PEP_ID=MMETSP0413-20121227/13885_1 /TAXON_ID=136452 /ORGANISM="Filamoeba nolandi, Strain NC-AS-23-1" /LENGTH=295 /DNA_ID=CAMNT_0008597389 /DNA_START=12 /DNA_END=899 /DNA_ORIENTATION=-
MSCCCCACINEKEYGIIQNFGKFVKVASPGCICLSWPCESLAGTVSTKLRQLVIRNEAKTKDNVFVIMNIAVQFVVIQENIQTAFYSMEDPNAQIQSFVENSLRSIVPTMDLDHLFLEKEKISHEIKDDLAKAMAGYGYTIVDTLITDIEPEHGVKAAMNRINESKRLREAAEFEAETAKLVEIKKAEAEAESKRLQGEGVAAQRKAILKGLQEGVDNLAHTIGVTAEETMKYTMMAQYFDMLRDIGTSQNKATLFIPHSPSHISDVASQLRGSMLESVALNQMDHSNNNAKKNF